MAFTSCKCPHFLIHTSSPTLPHTAQLWLVAIYFMVARSTPAVRVSIAAVVALASVAVLPPRLWQSQLKRLGILSAVLMTMTGAWGQMAGGMGLRLWGGQQEPYSAGRGGGSDGQDWITGTRAPIPILVPY